MATDDNKPSFARLLTNALEKVRADIRVSMPARVVKYDATIQAVDVLPLVREPYLDEQGNRQAAQLPVIPRVPVVFQGGGGFRMTLPVAVGDVVLLVFGDRSLDVWLSTGRLVDPLDDRTHTLSDAMAIPCLKSFNEPWLSAPTDRLSIGADEGDAVIEITNTEILAGGSDALALQSELDALRAAYKAHTHADPSSGSTGVPNNASGIPSSYPGTQVLKGS